ncbi:MAG: AAA family ATPase, partial [Pseudomonadota bacterium]
MADRPDFHIITGGPGSGKTTLIDALAAQGFHHRGRLREGAESYAKLAQIAGARSYLLLPSTVAPERRRLSSIRR